MNRWSVLFIGICIACCAAKEPFKPLHKTLPFVVYYTSRYRGICVGTLVARSVVLTAAVCVTNPLSNVPDRRPLNIVCGTMYRHPRRGIRVQVSKVIIPRMPEDLGHRANLLEKSAAVLLMKKRVPDILVENPVRALDVDWKGEDALLLQEECFMAGWHFFYRGDKIYPVHKFLLQRNLRVQFMNIVKMHEWCDALHLKMTKSLANIGFVGQQDKTAMVCAKDPDMAAQPCHGMYGSAFICHGRAVGMMMAPDAQWTNCTGFSNIIHLFSSVYLKDFFICISKLFQSDIRMDWNDLKKAIYDESPGAYDFVPALYDKLLVKATGSSSSSSAEQ